MATHSSILAWRIPQRSVAGYSLWGHKETNTSSYIKTEKHNCLKKCRAVIVRHVSASLFALPCSGIFDMPWLGSMVKFNVWRGIQGLLWTRP